MDNWMIGKKHPNYGKVTMMRTIEGEPYRFFTDKTGATSMIPLDVLQRTEVIDGRAWVKGKDRGIPFSIFNNDL